MRRGKWLQQFHEQHGRDAGYLSAKVVRRIMGVMWRRMEELGLTQAGVADRLEVSQPRVAQLMNDTPNLTMRSLVALAGALELDVDGVRFIDRGTGALYADTAQAAHVRWTVPGILKRDARVRPAEAPADTREVEGPWEQVLVVRGTVASNGACGEGRPWERDDVGLRDAA